MPKRRTGRPTLSYMGVEAPQPPNIVFHPRPPTVNDYKEFNTGDIWVDDSSLIPPGPTAPTNEDIWMLVSKNKNIANATWVNFGGGDLETLTGNTGGPIPGDANDNINVVTANSTVIFSGAVNTLTQNFGLTNLVLGSSLPALTTGVQNVGVGFESLDAITSANNNTAVGYQAADGLVTGTDNVIVGNTAGSNYVGAESSNILLSSPGVAAENQTIRIGSNQVATFIDGIAGVNIADANRAYVTIDTVTDQLGSNSFASIPWTPRLTFGGGSTDLTFSFQQGTYQTLGNLVFFSGSCILTNKGTSVGIARITGLPFPMAGAAAIYASTIASSRISLAVGRTFIWGKIEPGLTTITFESGGSGLVQIPLTDVEFVNNSTFTVTGFYFR